VKERLAPKKAAFGGESCSNSISPQVRNSFLTHPRLTKMSNDTTNIKLISMMFAAATAVNNYLVKDGRGEG
jgi:hypothetical protein